MTLSSDSMSALVPLRERLFGQFFASGMEESKSPFLTASSRRWGHHLPLKAALLAALLLLSSFCLSLGETTYPLAQLLLVFVYFLAGIPSLINALEDVASLDVNIDVLMTLAAFSSVFIGSGFEGGLLLVLFALSGSLEELVSSKAKDAISSLHKLTPTKACLIRADGILIERAVDDVTIGSRILVRAGELVPLDGRVIEGYSSLNLAHLTGESLPVAKKPGDEVAAGAQNLEGALTLEVVRTSSDSTLSRIIGLVTEAQEARPELQRWFDRLSSRYAFGIILFSLLAAASMPFLLGISFLGNEGSLYRSLAFLIAASPCALILAIPIAYLSAISACARAGILLKGGVVLDALARCHAISFDKTGTLTTGQLVCLGVERVDGPASEQELLWAWRSAHALEQMAIHPIAEAIVRYVEMSGELAKGKVALEEFRQIAGFGVAGIATSLTGERQQLYLGHLGFISEKLDPRLREQLQERVRQVQEEGELLALLLVGEQLYLFRFADELRPGIARAIAPLRERWGMQLYMMTGDHERSAQRVAQELSIDHYLADLRPEDKLRYVSRLSQEVGLAMVGDGVNDAPALARATVGISMGQVGSATAVEAADIVLLQDRLDKLDWLLDRAHLTRKIVIQNVVVATCALVGASLPALAGWVPLWLAVILHEGGTVVVGLNALRLLRR